MPLYLLNAEPTQTRAICKGQKRGGEIPLSTHKMECPQRPANRHHFSRKSHWPGVLSNIPKVKKKVWILMDCPDEHSYKCNSSYCWTVWATVNH